ncbi:MAG: hypothetical protein QXJ06_00595 [Candidatus Aenigmatarchaeota archaeon]
MRKNEKILLNGGLDRRQSLLAGAPNKAFDICNLLPRAPLGLKTIKKEKVINNFNFNIEEGICVNDNNNNLKIIARTSVGYKDLLSGQIENIPYNSNSQIHSISTFRGKLIINQQNETMVSYDIKSDNPNIRLLEQAPKCGISSEFRNRLFAGGDINNDDSAPYFDIKLYGLGIPLSPPQAIKVGVADVIRYPELGYAIITSLDGNFSGCLNKVIVIQSKGYKIKEVFGSNNEKAKVDLQGSLPLTQNNVSYEVYEPSLLYAYPNNIHLGTVYLFNKSGKASIRVFNTTSTPIKITNIKSNEDIVLIEDIPNLPYTLEGGNSISFNVLMMPDKEGINNGNVIIEHDYYAQDSLLIKLECEGTEREVLANPSVVSFGSWIINNQSPEMKIDIVNPLSESVYIDVSECVLPSSPFILSSPNPFPTEDIEIKPNQKYTLGFKFQPTSSGSHSGYMRIKRYLKPKPFRIYYSKVADETKWNRDRDWVDISIEKLTASRITALKNYGDMLIAFTDNTITAIMTGGIDGGFRPIRLAMGEGIGALSQNAVKVGGGLLFWVAKNGCYIMRGNSINKVSTPIEDLFDGELENVYVEYYDNSFLVSMKNSIYVFRVDDKFTIWRLGYNAYPIIVDNSLNRKETLYGVIRANGNSVLYKLDEEEKEGVKYSIQTRYIDKDLDRAKRLLQLNITTNDPLSIESVKAIFSNSYEEKGYPQEEIIDRNKTIYYRGLALYDYEENCFIIDDTLFENNELVNKELVIDILNQSYIINSNTRTKIYINNNNPLFTNNIFLLITIKDEIAEKDFGLQPIYFYFKDNSVSSHFYLKIEGTTTKPFETEITSISIDYDILSKSETNINS